MKSLSQQCRMMLLVIFISILLAGFVPFSFASPVIRRFQFNVSLNKKVSFLFLFLIKATRIKNETIQAGKSYLQLYILFLTKMDVSVWLLSFITENYRFFSNKGGVEEGDKIVPYKATSNCKWTVSRANHCSS